MVRHCFNTQPPEGGCYIGCSPDGLVGVSTHSHPKVAGLNSFWLRIETAFQHTATRRWLWSMARRWRSALWFQHTATRRWLAHAALAVKAQTGFQHTATRRWLLRPLGRGGAFGGFNTQPPEGGCSQTARFGFELAVSTHSHPKVAAGFPSSCARRRRFQHTATRRWLLDSFSRYRRRGVSTHSHPKMAALIEGKSRAVSRFQHTATRRWLSMRWSNMSRMLCFNTQPPEGGCAITRISRCQSGFQHTATRRWLLDTG